MDFSVYIVFKGHFHTMKWVFPSCIVSEDFWKRWLALLHVLAIYIEEQ